MISHEGRGRGGSFNDQEEETLLAKKREELLLKFERIRARKVEPSEDFRIEGLTGLPLPKTGNLAFQGSIDKKKEVA